MKCVRRAPSEPFCCCSLSAGCCSLRCYELGEHLNLIGVLDPPRRRRGVADMAHGTLVAATVKTVTLDSNWHWIEVLNRDGAAEITFLVDPGVEDPTVGMDDAYIIPATMAALRARSFETTPDGTVVKMISAGTPTYTVRGVLA